jgi:segregation and condensation protein A
MTLAGSQSPSPGTAPASASTAALSIAFGEGRRPDATVTHVTSPAFTGPLGLLLALIEARQLDVLSVPLGDLAGAYLEALASLEDDRIGNISSFVAVASQLILIKSRAMLPRHEDLPPGVLPEDEPDPEAELRTRLLLYRAHRDAGRRLQELALARVGLWRREASAAAAAALAGARPPDAPPLDPRSLVAALDGLARIAEPPELPPEVVPRTITLAERASIIREALLQSGAGSIVLQELLRGVRDRVVVAVTFLAMLELVKRREITVSQDAPWAPIVVRAMEPSA